MWFFPFHAQTVVQLFPSALPTPESKIYIYTLPLSHPRIDNARGRRRHFRFVSIQPPRVVPFSPLSSSARLPYLKDARLLSSLLWSFFSPGKCNSRIPTEEVARALSSRGPIELRTRADKKRSARAQGGKIEERWGDEGDSEKLKEHWLRLMTYLCEDWSDRSLAGAVLHSLKNGADGLRDLCLFESRIIWLRV